MICTLCYSPGTYDVAIATPKQPGYWRSLPVCALHFEALTRLSCRTVAELRAEVSDAIAEMRSEVGDVIGMLIRDETHA